MTIRRRRYEPKVRVALTVMIVLLLAAPAIALRNCVANFAARSPVASGHDIVDDRLVTLRNGTTMLLDRGSLSPKIINWLKLQTDERTAFEVADTNFQTGSADPATHGLGEVAQLATMLKVDPHLTAEVIVAPNSSDDQDTIGLERSRAAVIAGELSRQGVAPKRVTTAIQPAAGLDANYVIDHPGQDSRLYIVLSR